MVSGITQRILTYGNFLRGKLDRLAGKDYLVCAPGCCAVYAPASVEFYYRDFTPKINWPGAVDANGIPVAWLVGQAPFYHPVLLAQIALGHWNIRHREADGGAFHEGKFLGLAEWFTRHQDGEGGWPIALFGNDPTYLCPYSAMAQGQVMSVLVRAYSATRDSRFLTAARKSIELLLRPMDQGGTCRYEGNELILEEYPQRHSRTVLNGWIHALFGLHDYLLVEFDQTVQEALDSTVRAVAARLPRYDAGFWSFYDLRRTYASFYYHREHISQLTMLATTFPAHAQTFERYRSRFYGYLKSPVARVQSFAVRGARQLRGLPKLKTTFVRGSQRPPAGA